MPRFAKFRVESISPPAGSRGDGLHWFRIDFSDRQGRCLITTGEAQHLRQLTTDWVERALGNLAEQRGREWVVETACSSPGLILHHSDAGDPIGLSRAPGRAFDFHR
jgi:hypothetical protein